MDYAKLQRLREKLYFTVEDVTAIWNIQPASARVLCNRYARKGVFLRLKNNFYVLEQNWQNFSPADFLRISNFLQVPSYVSFMTALAFYEVTTQIQRNFFESVSLKRSVQFNIKGVAFNFYKLKKGYYFDFIKQDNVFIATKEKALIDAVYLASFGKYQLDFSSLDFNKLNKSKLKKVLTVFPRKTKQIMRKLLLY